MRKEDCQKKMGGDLNSSQTNRTPCKVEVRNLNQKYDVQTRITPKLQKYSGNPRCLLFPRWLDRRYTPPSATTRGRSRSARLA